MVETGGKMLLTGGKLKTSNIKQTETLLKSRYKRFSIYKNSTGNFNPDFYSGMCLDLIKLKFKLLKIRHRQTDKRMSAIIFKFDRMAFVIKNQFYNLSDFSDLGIWNIELKYRSLKKNRFNSKSSMYGYLRFIKNLQKI